MPKKITVRVNPDGTTSIDFEGYEGPSCIDADETLRNLLSSLGVRVEQTSFTPKPELNQEEHASTQEHHRGETSR